MYLKITRAGRGIMVAVWYFVTHRFNQITVVFLILFITGEIAVGVIGNEMCV